MFEKKIMKNLQCVEVATTTWFIPRKTHSEWEVAVITWKLLWLLILSLFKCVTHSGSISKLEFQIPDSNLTTLFLALSHPLEESWIKFKLWVSSICQNFLIFRNLRFFDLVLYIFQWKNEQKLNFWNCFHPNFQQ